MHQHPYKHNSQAFFNSPTFEKVALPKMWKTDFNKSDTNEKKIKNRYLRRLIFKKHFAWPLLISVNEVFVGSNFLRVIHF